VGGQAMSLWCGEIHLRFAAQLEMRLRRRWLKQGMKTLKLKHHGTIVK